MTTAAHRCFCLARSLRIICVGGDSITQVHFCRLRSLGTVSAGVPGVNTWEGGLMFHQEAALQVHVTLVSPIVRDFAKISKGLKSFTLGLPRRQKRPAWGRTYTKQSIIRLSENISYDFYASMFETHAATRKKTVVNIWSWIWDVICQSWTI